MLIRKVFGVFNLFRFPDMDTGPGKSGLKKQCVSGKDTWLGRQLLSRQHGGRPPEALLRGLCPQRKGL